jgi:hypothetical protein
MDPVALRAGIHEEEEGGEGYYLPFPVEQEGEAEGVMVEGPEAPIGRLEDQEEHQDDCDRNVAVAVAAGCGGKEVEGGYIWADEVRHVEATQREAAVLDHDREILGEEAHEQADVYEILLDVVLVQLADRQAAAVDCGDHACQIREKPHTMAT